MVGEKCEAGALARPVVRCCRRADPGGRVGGEVGEAESQPRVHVLEPSEEAVTDRVRCHCEDQ